MYQKKYFVFWCLQWVFIKNIFALRSALKRQHELVHWHKFRQTLGSALPQEEGLHYTICCHWM